MQRLGAWLWLVRPAYILIELVVAAGVSGAYHYSFADNTISDLGVVRCASLVQSIVERPACSPRHEFMNSAFIVFGACLAVGALLQRERFGAGGRATAATALLVVSGLSSIGTGLAPLDQGADLHYVVSLPVFVGQPLAFLLLGSLMWRERRVPAAALVTVGVVTAFAALGFAVTGDMEHGRGVLERLALWPAFAALAALGADALRHPAVTP